MKHLMVYFCCWLQCTLVLYHGQWQFRWPTTKATNQRALRRSTFQPMQPVLYWTSKAPPPISTVLIKQSMCKSELIHQPDKEAKKYKDSATRTHYVKWCNKRAFFYNSWWKGSCYDYEHVTTAYWYCLVHVYVITSCSTQHLVVTHHDMLLMHHTGV